ncbi:monovalent cation/H(+) antiporter subunit G [Sphingobacterium lactis]|uniref:Multicomponent Na+:H+ antiporter subunit G n=1 Tax=Sphingobacterium lactis TaxID=797291 RepID=A0A1H5S5F8_9SPHI|nr:monovalent cation/H(+) antiporter subunit G [Sphingobacterium lactis]SEF45883.1 multicomponent Na+:H+ antiporter subunit G [Sphingobacterium lactis]
MIDIILAIFSTIGALSILFAAIGVLRMPDFYLRLSVTVKAATLGVGLLLTCAAIMFPEDVSVTTKSIAIIFFLLLTAPIAAHMIAKAAYFTGTPLWKGTVVDRLQGMYNKETHCLESDPKKADRAAEDNIADTDDATD